MKRPVFALPAIALLLLTATPAYADAPSRVRELTCTDGTVFTG